MGLLGGDDARQHPLRVALNVTGPCADTSLQEVRLLSESFCSTCGVPVPEQDGCKRCHVVASAAPPESLRAIRAEVYKAFDDARLEVTGVMTKVGATVAGSVGGPAPAAPIGRGEGPAVVAPPARRLDVPPPPPPPPAPGLGSVRRRPNTFSSLREAAPLQGDPIQAFAPAPTMDWGPARWSRFRRRAS